VVESHPSLFRAKSRDLESQRRPRLGQGSRAGTVVVHRARPEPVARRRKGLSDGLRVGHHCGLARRDQHDRVRRVRGGGRGLREVDAQAGDGGQGHCESQVREQGVERAEHGGGPLNYFRRCWMTTAYTGRPRLSLRN
jgi:hypothetical protein